MAKQNMRWLIIIALVLVVMYFSYFGRHGISVQWKGTTINLVATAGGSEMDSKINYDNYYTNTCGNDGDVTGSFNYEDRGDKFFFDFSQATTDRSCSASHVATFTLPDDAVSATVYCSINAAGSETCQHEAWCNVNSNELAHVSKSATNTYYNDPTGTIDITDRSIVVSLSSNACDSGSNGGFAEITFNIEECTANETQRFTCGGGSVIVTHTCGTDLRWVVTNNKCCTQEGDIQYCDNNPAEMAFRCESNDWVRIGNCTTPYVPPSDGGSSGGGGGGGSSDDDEDEEGVVTVANLTESYAEPTEAKKQPNWTIIAIVILAIAYYMGFEKGPKKGFIRGSKGGVKIQLKNFWK